MSKVDEQISRHPDVFTASEALAFLHLDPEKNAHTITTLKGKGLLTGWTPGRETLYHRKELEALIVNGFAHVFTSERAERNAQPTVGPRLKLARGN